MPKPDPALLDSARYPFHCEITPRFGDLDTNMHINNVALVGMLEDARVRYHRASGYHQAIAGLSSMVASLNVEYLGQTFYPDDVIIHVGASRMGRTSYTLDQLVTQHGNAVAYAHTVIVCTDQGRPTEIPQAFRDGVLEWMVRP